MPYITDEKSQHRLRSQSEVARSAMMNSTASATHSERRMPVRSMTSHPHQFMRPPPGDHRAYLSDTPLSTAPNSPNIPPKRQNSGDRIYRPKPTTLDIPGLTCSKVSPDGRIAMRDRGSKLIIIMVGLPARGKSYITKKLARYLNWLQHDTRIFNVGERRRVVGKNRSASPKSPHRLGQNGTYQAPDDVPTMAARVLSNGQTVQDSTQDVRPSARIPELRLPEPEKAEEQQEKEMKHDAKFFDPTNTEGSRLREQAALDTLDELLEYILFGNGSVAIFDATNSTRERRRVILEHIRQRAGNDINVMFLESACVDEDLLERNVRLKLSGPDYKDKDPEASLKDFRERIKMYEKSYVPLGEFEENQNMPFVRMVDVGRKVIAHQTRGFLSNQIVSYLLNFNLAPRQIWITRHGESYDNVSGKIGGDAGLTPYGQQYARALTNFLGYKRKEWEIHELDKGSSARESMLPGDLTPPNPHYPPDGDPNHILDKSFCVWTSMLKRSIETAEYFNDDDFEVKQWKIMDEINGGSFEGMTYDQIKSEHREEYDRRRSDKLHYRYPGPGGESYLDVVNRLRPIITEVERTTDHVLLIGHRSIARVLLAYFLGLKRQDTADLDVPIGVVWCLEPKPYGVDFKAFRFNDVTHDFDLEPDYKLQPARSHLD